MNDKYELAETGDLNLIIEANTDEEYWEKINSWQKIVEDKLAEIGIELKWDSHTSENYNPEGYIYDFSTEKWEDFAISWKRRYGLD